jgi:hypothetical protein
MQRVHQGNRQPAQPAEDQDHQLPAGLLLKAAVSFQRSAKNRLKMNFLLLAES